MRSASSFIATALNQQRRKAAGATNQLCVGPGGAKDTHRSPPPPFSAAFTQENSWHLFCKMLPAFVTPFLGLSWSRGRWKKALQTSARLEITKQRRTNSQKRACSLLRSPLFHLGLFGTHRAIKPNPANTAALQERRRISWRSRVFTLAGEALPSI